jgi:hypothetical protein
MNDVLHALGMSAGILFLVVVVIIIVSMAAVNRGALAHTEAESHALDESLPAKEPAAAAAGAKPAKPGLPAGDEINVPMILALGLALFVLSVAALMLLSLIEHLG